MSSLNKVMLIGNLGSDPELKTTTSGKSVCNFSLATTEKWTGADGQKQEETTWFNIVLWGKIGEVCANFLSKGSKVFVEGKFKHRDYEDKDGIKRRAFDVVGREVTFLSPKKDGGGDQATEPEPGFDSSDEIPF